MTVQVAKKGKHKTAKLIRVKDHFSTTYQAASALVLNGKITIQNLDEARKTYDKKVVGFAEKILRDVNEQQ